MTKIQKRIRQATAIAIISAVVSNFVNCQKNDDSQMDPNQNKSEIHLENLEWIVGTWQRETSRGTMFEDWKVANDTLWQGKAFRLTEGDTLIIERLSLEIMRDEIFYVPVVPHNEGAVYFRMIEQSPEKVVFENPEHDFPQRIIYMKISDDSLHARIEGINEGVDSAVDFYYKRMK